MERSVFARPISGRDRVVGARGVLCEEEPFHPDQAGRYATKGEKSREPNKITLQFRHYEVENGLQGNRRERCEGRGEKFG